MACAGGLSALRLSLNRERRQRTRLHSASRAAGHSYIVCSLGDILSCWRNPGGIAWAITDIGDSGPARTRASRTAGARCGNATWQKNALPALAH